MSAAAEQEKFTGLCAEFGALPPGTVVRFAEGIDFTIKPGTFRNKLHRSMRGRGWLVTSVLKGESVYAKITGPAPAAAVEPAPEPVPAVAAAPAAFAPFGAPFLPTAAAPPTATGKPAARAPSAVFTQPRAGGATGTARRVEISSP